MLYWISASAGSGKTKAVIDRVSSLLQNGAGSGVLCLTYTNHAVDEIKRRVCKYGSDDVAVSTFHSYCGDVIREFADYLDIPRNYKTVADDHERELMQKAAIASAIHDNQKEFLEALSRSSLDYFYDHCIKMMQNIENYPIEELGPCDSYDNFSCETLANLNKISISSGLYDFGVELDKIAYARKVLAVGPRGKDSDFINARNGILGSLTDDIGHYEGRVLRNNIKKIAHCAYQNYKTQKARRGLCDFYDIIDKMLYLVSKSARKDFVLYSIHRKFPHILIDEAQDLSKKQWQIIELISDPVFSNNSGSVFIVGDPKQSIYSFQGANQESFLKMRSDLIKKAKHYNIKYEAINLDFSYRSTPIVLKFVDKICNLLNASLGCDEKIVHQCKKGDSKNSTVETKGFANIDEAVDGVTKKIINLLDRQINPNDIMILVRTRSDLDHYLTNKLSSMGIPYMMHARKPVLENPVVMDLIAIGRLAIDKACMHSKMRIAVLLGAKLTEIDWHHEVFSRIQEAYLDSVSSVQFYLKIIKTIKIFFIKKYGKSSVNIINNFIDLAMSLSYSHKEFLGFIASHRNYSTYFGSDGIKIMTVHGAKGLQAKVVFIIDSCNLPRKHDDGELERAIDEYYRTFYVAITRSEEELYFYYYNKPHDKSWASVCLS